MEIPAAVQHAESADLDAEVRKLHEAAHVGTPDRENFVAVAVVRCDAEQSAGVIENHVGLRKGAQQIDEVGQLRMKLPRFEREAERLQTGEAFAKGRVQHLVLRHFAPAELGRIAGIPGHTVANAANPSIARGDERLEHRLHPLAQGEIGVSDEACA